MTKTRRLSSVERTVPSQSLFPPPRISSQRSSKQESKRNKLNHHVPTLHSLLLHGRRKYGESSWYRPGWDPHTLSCFLIPFPLGELFKKQGVCPMFTQVSIGVCKVVYNFIIPPPPPNTKNVFCNGKIANFFHNITPTTPLHSRTESLTPVLVLKIISSWTGKYTFPIIPTPASCCIL